MFRPRNRISRNSIGVGGILDDMMLMSHFLDNLPISSG